MKQLKIIADTYDNTTGLIQVNFNQEILIEPQSEIAMDKFSMEVTNGLTDNFELPNQIVYIDTNVLDTRTTARGAIVPAKTYLNMEQLLLQLNESFNGVLDSDMIKSSNVNQSNTADNGLFFRTWIDSTSQKINIGFGSSGIDYTNSNFLLTNMTFVDKNGSNPSELFPADGGEYTLGTSLPIVAGGVDVRFNLTGLSTNNTVNSFQYGLFLNGVLQYGISKVGTQFYFVNATIATAIDSEPFINHAALNHQFYIEQGSLVYSVNISNTSSIFVQRFTGWSFNSTYYFGISGTYNKAVDTVPVSFKNLGVIYQSNITANTFGITWDYTSFTAPEYLSFFELGLTAGSLPPNRIVGLDFTEAGTLQYGLGYVAPVFNLGTGIGAPTGSYAATDPFGFNDYYTLALQCPSLQIESYVATADRKFGGRSNNLCYFTATPTAGVTSTIYTYDQRELLFLTLSNKERINMNSFQFRVIYANDPTQRSFVKCDQMSFNLYIKEKSSL